MTSAETLGQPISWGRVGVPERAALLGKAVRLEPVDPQRHAEELFNAAQGPGADPRLWDYMPVGPFEDQQHFFAWLEGTAASRDPLFYTVVDETNRPSGMVSYLRIEPNDGVIEIGNIWFGPLLQRTPGATEAIFLLARHAFDQLGYRRLEWKCDALNARSRRAAERFGFGFEGIFRQHKVVKGRNRDTAWFSMLDGEWPILRSAFERWLAPGNFTSDNRQRQSLSAIRAALHASVEHP